MTSSAFRVHWNARSASSCNRASWRPSSNSEDNTRPIGGPHCGSAIRLTIIRSSTCWTSSSRNISTSARSTVDASAATRSALTGSASHLPVRLATSALRSFVSTLSADRKFSRTNVLSPSPSWSFLRLMIAVCGMGMPSGCLNSAVTANQSASAPTMPASAAARTYPTHGPASPRDCSHEQSRKITAAPSRKLSATIFIRRRARLRSASAAESTPVSASAKLGRGPAETDVAAGRPPSGRCATPP